MESHTNFWVNRDIVFFFSILISYFFLKNRACFVTATLISQLQPQGNAANTHNKFCDFARETTCLHEVQCYQPLSVRTLVKYLHSEMSEEPVIDGGLYKGEFCRLICLRRKKIKRMLLLCTPRRHVAEWRYSSTHS